MIFECAEVNQSLEQQEEIKPFTCDLDATTTLLNTEKVIIYYIAGYIAKSLVKTKCDACNALISSEKEHILLIIKGLSEDMG